MARTARILVAIGLVLALVGGEPASGATEPRALVNSPWGKDDTVGDAARSRGDVRRVVITNGPNVTFMFRMVAKPLWDNFATSRATHMRFLIDWRNTSAAFDRRVTASWSEGAWRIVVSDANGGARCLRNGGVQQLTKNRYRFSVPAGMCLGGQRAFRVASTFVDDRDDSAADDLHLDRVPNHGGYGPFIRLP